MRVSVGVRKVAAVGRGPLGADPARVAGGVGA